MVVSVRVLFDAPQREIASLLRDRLEHCKSASFVSGFITVEGVEAIAPAIRTNPAKLSCMVAGAGTYRAYEAFDGLIASDVPLDRFHVHLGHTRKTGSSARYKFYRYHPMLHSKVSLLEMTDGTACAFIGSHNLTGFALLGLNGEAGVLIEGPSDSPQIAAVREHIRESVSQSVSYIPGMKEAYTWWNMQFIDGLRTKFGDEQREDEGKKTIVILAAQIDEEVPQEGDIVYFELPEALGRIGTLNAEVHIYLFKGRLPSPNEALARLDDASASLWCKILGIEDDQGGKELSADWQFHSRSAPRLTRTPVPFRPSPLTGFQQVRVKVFSKIFDSFEYLFDVKRKAWTPELADDGSVGAPADDRKFLQSLSLIPPEHNDWYLVKGLTGDDVEGKPAYREALEQSSPASGAFFLFSLRRKKRGRRK